VTRLGAAGARTLRYHNSLHRNGTRFLLLTMMGKMKAITHEKITLSIKVSHLKRIVTDITVTTSSIMIQTYAGVKK